MEDMILIENLSFNYDNIQVFKDFNLNIKKGTFTTVIGNGKSTFVNLLAGQLKGSGTIKIDGHILDHLKKTKSNVGIICQSIDNYITAETVMDEIAFSLSGFNYDEKTVREKVLEVSDLLGITEVLKEDPKLLSSDYKLLVSIASCLVHNPSVVIIDWDLNKYGGFQKEKILNVIRNVYLTKGLTVIHAANDIEDVFFGNEILFINNGKKVIQGSVESVLSNKAVFEAYHIDRPFIVELSERLMFYGVINHIYYDMNRLVDDIWK